MKSFAKSIVVAALTFEARLVLWRKKPKIVGVTGNVGKTGTKDAIYTVLASRARTRKSEKSYNSDVGVPLTVLGLPTAWDSLIGWADNLLSGALTALSPDTYPEWLVLEIGADRPGDIVGITQWIKPDIAVLTRFPDVPVHVEFFSSPEAVVEEKRALRRALKEGGTLVVNADDPLVNEEPIREGQHRYSYGIENAAADIHATDIVVRHEEGVAVGMQAHVAYQNMTVPLTLDGTLGTHPFYPLLAAVAVGVSEGMTLTSACAALSEAHTPPRGRMRVLSGRSSATLIDDTYNSSPVALAAALDALASLECSGKRIVVLGDMMELGTYSVEEHAKVGTRVAEVADVFVAVGIRMHGAAKVAAESGMEEEQLHACDTAEEAATFLESKVGAGDIVLLKGSQSMRIERVTKVLLAPEIDPKSVLVRQEEEWERR